MPIFSREEAEEPEPPLKRCKINQTEKHKGLSTTEWKQLDEAAPQTNEPSHAQPPLGTIRGMKKDRPVMADTDPNGKASVFENGTAGILLIFLFGQFLPPMFDNFKEKLIYCRIPH